MLAARRVKANQMEIVEVDQPVPGEGEVLVKVAYAGVNPFDVQVLSGQIGGVHELTLGAEATGYVDGNPVHVSGSGLGSSRDGTYAEWVVAPTSAARPLPADADLEKCATVGVAGKTAWRVVNQLAKVTSADTVLVLGASGGVGTYAAQFAAKTGAKVIAHTSTQDKVQFLGSLGFPTVVATEEEISSAVTDSKISVVLDPLGGNFMANLFEVVEPRTRFISYGTLAGAMTQMNLAKLYSKALSIAGTSGATTLPEFAAEALQGALDSVHTGEVKIKTQTIDLNQATKAIDLLVGGAVEGKLVLKTNSTEGEN